MLSTKKSNEYSTKEISHRDLVLAVSIILALALFHTFFGEAIPFNGGFGFDGRYYGGLANDFWGYLQDPEFSAPTRAGRILPSLLIYYALKGISAPRSNENIVVAFQLLNGLCLLASAALWWSICRREKIKRGAFWCGFLGLFINFMNAKMAFYYSVLMDSAGFLLGTVILYGFLNNSRFVVFLAGGIALFTWPTASYLSLMLLAWSRSTEDFSLDTVPRKNRLLIKAATAAIFVIFAMTCIVQIYIKGYRTVTPTWMEVLPLSIALLAGFAAGGTAPLVKELGESSWRKLIAAVEFRYLVSFGIMMIIGNSITNSLIHRQGKSTLQVIFGDGTSIFVLGTVAPMVFFVAHAVYLGPIISIAALRHKAVAKEARNLGPSGLLVLAAMLALAVTSETRHLVQFLPFLVYLVAKDLDRLLISFKPVAVLAVLSLFWSKAWFQINTAYYQFIWPLEGNALEFPQSYYMNFGPWMSQKVYIIHGMGVLLSLVLVYFAFQHRRRQI